MINEDRKLDRDVSKEIADVMEATLEYHAALGENHKEWLISQREKAEKDVQIAQARLGLIYAEIRLYESVLGDDWESV